MQRMTLPVNKFSRKAAYLLHAYFGDMGDAAYTLWRREGGVFVHVDTFHAFKNASEEAQEIIKNSVRFSWLANE